MLKIDMHTHILPKHLPDFTEKFGYEGFIRLDHHKPDHARMMSGTRFFREIESNCWDEELRIGQYASFGVQAQVVSTIPVLFYYWAKAEHALETSVFLNDHLAGLVARYPKNYIGLGTLPMQDTELAIRELERCRAIGLAGVQIGSNINDKNLGEPEFFPVFEACADLGMALFVHPWNMMGQQHMEKYWLPWLVGMPAETSRAVCSMIFSGVLERLPDLRVNFAHAGGSFLPTIGRVEHGYRCRPDLVAVDNPHPPSSYLGKFWVDCITHDARMLAYVLETAGPDKVTLGSDYPFPLGDLEIGAFIETMNLPQDTLERIYHGNTLEWLQLDRKAFE